MDMNYILILELYLPKILIPTWLVKHSFYNVVKYTHKYFHVNFSRHTRVKKKFLNDKRQDHHISILLECVLECNNTCLYLTGNDVKTEPIQIQCKSVGVSHRYTDHHQGRGHP